MRKLNNIIQVVGGWTIILFPVILILMIWFDHKLMFNIMLTDGIIFLSCLIFDKITE